MPDTPAPLPDFTRWPSFPFEGDIRVKRLEEPVDIEPPRKGEDAADCTACSAPDEAYIWVSERWRVRTMDRPTGLPMVLILESRSHLDLGDLPNMLAAELGVMTVRLERAVRSLDGVARVHVNRWGDGEAHLHLWFMARPHGRLQLRGTFLSLWDEILPPVPEAKWRENLALVAAWLAEFGGTPLAEPPRIEWKAPAKLDSSVASVEAKLIRGNDEPVDARAEASRDAKAEAPAASRAEAPADSPAEARADLRADASADGPADADAATVSQHAPQTVPQASSRSGSPTAKPSPTRAGSSPARSSAESAEEGAEPAKAGAETPETPETAEDAATEETAELPAQRSAAGEPGGRPDAKPGGNAGGDPVEEEQRPVERIRRPVPGASAASRS